MALLWDSDMANSKRQWQPREMRLVSEWIAETYPDYPSQTRVRLGPIRTELQGVELTDAELRGLGVWRRWADAIVFMPDRLVLIEAKIRPGPGDISQVELYEDLIPKTPELKEHKGKRIEKLLLYAIDDKAIAAMAKRRGIRVVLFHPSWVDEYLLTLYPRERRAPRS